MGRFMEVENANLSGDSTWKVGAKLARHYAFSTEAWMFEKWEVKACYYVIILLRMLRALNLVAQVDLLRLLTQLR